VSFDVQAKEMGGEGINNLLNRDKKLYLRGSMSLNEPNSDPEQTAVRLNGAIYICIEKYGAVTYVSYQIFVGKPS